MHSTTHTISLCSDKERVPMKTPIDKNYYSEYNPIEDDDFYLRMHIETAYGFLGYSIIANLLLIMLVIVLLLVFL